MQRRRRGEGISTRVKLQLTNAFRYQAFNATSTDQYHTASQTGPYTSFYPSVHLETSINADVAATPYMTMINDAKASQMDTGNYEEREDRYVVWGASDSL